MKIIKYEEKYRDDMIFMILQAKDALGRVPGLNDDLLDIKANYFDKGDSFGLLLMTMTELLEAWDIAL